MWICPYEGVGSGDPLNASIFRSIEGSCRGSADAGCGLAYHTLHWVDCLGTGAQFLVRGLLDHFEGHVVAYGLQDQTLSLLRCWRLRAGNKDLRGLGLPW